MNIAINENMEGKELTITTKARKAFLLIAEECRKNITNFREIHNPFPGVLIGTIITGKSGEKYTIELDSSSMRVDWGIYSVSFDDYTSEESEIKKLYNEIKDNMVKDPYLVENLAIIHLIKDFEV